MGGDDSQKLRPNKPPAHTKINTLTNVRRIHNGAD